MIKQEFRTIYKSLEHCSHIPNQYFGHLLTLAGIVYNSETDKEIEDELNKLSIAYNSVQNSTLEKVKSIVHEIVFWTKPEKSNRLPDIEHIIHTQRNANIDQINTLILNLAQLNNIGQENRNETTESGRQVKIEADFSPLIRQLEQMMKDLKVEKTQEFNIPKIIGFITQKGLQLGYLETQNEE